ncbi:MAG TPA: dihydropteroate synthase [Steroidobacteraceae bacterium]|nr:dihydropteroate synthase [Steroidobacteraceae bacterium]HQR48716.1 dihydropteroate synthase [Steroidobacteraceae bacterium]
MKLVLPDRVLPLDEPVVMGVLNVTPDSFSDGGIHAGVEGAVAHGEKMVEEGAAIIDVGGESTRPGAAPVSADEEIRRVVPVIERLAGRVRVPISVDTSKPAVMQAAIEAGAVLVNDVRALKMPGALEAVAAGRAAVCLMHMQGEPRSMQEAPRYDDVVAEVREFLRARTAACERAGIPHERICVDPGIGFGKTPAHNLALLARLAELSGDGPPVLVGVSRKSLVGIITGRPPGERLAGSIAFAALAVANGAAIIRAHDVAATVDAVRVACALRRATTGDA